MTQPPENRHSLPVWQDPLPGTREYSYSPLRLDSKNALARALRPEYVGIIPADYQDITPELLELAAAERLRGSLLDVPAQSSGAVGYLSPQRERLMYVAVTPSEFGMLSGSVINLGERAVQASVKKRHRPQGLSQPDRATTVRAGLHAVADRAARVQKYLDNDLSKQFDLIAKFQEAASHPGFARFGNEANMRQQLTYVRTFIFGGMLQALASQRHWTPAQQSLAERTIDARIFLDRENNRHIANFKGLLDLAEEWNVHKWAIAAGRLWQSKNYLSEHEV